MKIVLQRVNSASVEVENKVIGSINNGCIAFLGIAESDTKETVERAVEKIYKLRIYADNAGKTNLSAKEIQAEILIISQFALLAECHSNRPSFSKAANKELAYELYNYFIEKCNERFKHVSTGKFGAHMHVFSLGDGPMTLILEV